MIKNYPFTFILILMFLFTACKQKQEIDVLVIGGGASGIAAGIQAARMEVPTLILEEYEWLGGALTSAGVSCIDGCYKLPSGLFGEFRNKLINHYGNENAMHTSWVSAIAAEPSAMNKVLQEMANAEPFLNIRYKSVVQEIKKAPKGWTVTYKDRNNDLQTIHTRILIDGTELGDVAKMCGVKYDIGMDARDTTGEAIAPEKANEIIQDITYVAILKDYGKDVIIPEPEGYNPSLFYCTCKTHLCTNFQKGSHLWDCDRMMSYGKLPNNKYMLNWPIEGNDYYANLIELSPKERENVLKKAKNFTLCYLYYLQTALGYNTLGLADDEFPTADRLPFIPYNRESRRIHGKVRFTLNDITAPYTQSQKLYRTAIAVGDYPVDHHHGRYQGQTELPDLQFYPVPSFGLPLGTLIPENTDDLIVTEKSISVSNLANGTTRLQPVLMEIGQAAGALAALAVKKDLKVAEVPVRRVQRALLNANCYLLPYLDLPVQDKYFKAVQRIGATGILKGRGTHSGWANQTWFDADSCLTANALLPELKDYYPDIDLAPSDKPASVYEAFELIEEIRLIVEDASHKEVDISPELASNLWKTVGLTDYNPNRTISRKEFAVLLDTIIDPFNSEPIDITGEIME